MDGTIIVADDDRTIRTVISHALTRAGARVRATGLSATLWKWVEEGEGDVVITDVKMPDGDALDFLPAMRKHRPDLPIIVMSAQTTLLTALRASDAGAYEYLPKPFDLSALLAKTNQALKANAATRPNPDNPDIGQEPGEGLIGSSPNMQALYRVIARVKDSDLPLMIIGESGSGKGLVAQEIHQHGARSHGEMVRLDLASPIAKTPAELRAAMQAAHRGVLFLDHLDDATSETQAALLFALQALGDLPDSPDIRIFSAVKRDLSPMIENGAFREDLFFRLNVTPVQIPPLRNRVEDISSLASHFLAEKAPDQTQPRKFEAEAIELLKKHPWRGNVRELRNLVATLATGNPAEAISANELAQHLGQHSIGAADMFEQNTTSLSQSVESQLERYFSFHGNGLPPAGLYMRILREVEAPLISLTLRATYGNQIKAAEILGLNRNTLRKKIKELGIDVHKTKSMS